MSADPSLIRTSEGDDGVQFGTEERSVLKMGRSARDAPRIFPKGIDPSMYTLEQLAFLSRKEQGIMPTSKCLLYTSPSPRDRTRSRMPSSA